MRGQRGRYAAAVVVMGVAVALTFVIDLALAAAVDLVLNGKTGSVAFAVEVLKALGVRGGEAGTLWIPALIIVLAAVGSGAMMFLKGRWVAYACEGVIRSLRDTLYNRLQHAPLSFHDKHQTGDLVQRCTSDVETLRNFYTNQIVEISRSLLLLMIGVPLLFYFNWKMAIAATVMLPVIVTFSYIFFNRVKKDFKAMDDAEGFMSAVLQENLTGIRVVRAFNRQEFEIERFDDKNRTHRDLDWVLLKLMAWFWSISDMMCFTQILLVLGYGAYSVSHGQISVGEMLFFITVVWKILWPVREMGRTLTELGKAVVSVGRVHEIASHPAEPEPENPAKPVGNVSGAIEIRNLSFAHGDKKILDNITLSIPAGKTVALLGPSGSGKTSLVSLLLRFYDYTDGSITLDGQELKDLPRAYTRAQFATVMQEPFLFSKSIRDNIRLGRADFAEIADETIINAAQQSAVHESIQGFDQKYDTLVGERGVTLSGGQRQRVAIARALLRSSPILILDDALSAVDTHTEADILGALKTRRGQTTILIAHRLSTLMHADQIAVLEHGRLTQLGTHEQLSSQPGLYQRLWQIQTALEEDLKAELESDLVAK